MSSGFTASSVFTRVARAAGFAASLLLLCALGFAQSVSQPELLSIPGGFLERATSLEVRPLLSASQIQALLPTRGLFTFPAPYNTQAIRLTNAGDCAGADCVDYVGYSYWRNINNHTGSDTMLIFLGLNRARGGGGPTLFSYNKLTDAVTVVGPLFDASSPLAFSSGEGWYFSGTQPTKIYVNDGPRMLRYDVISRQAETVFDVRAQFGSDKYIWQMHSSDDDRVHSATLRRTTTFEMLGCLAYREDTGQFLYYPKQGIFDECHLDRSGRWLVLLDNVDGAHGEDNRIIDLQTGSETLLLDQNGAAGHADMGYGYMLAADNWSSLPNAQMLWRLGVGPLSGELVHHNMDWSVLAPNHVSHTNAKTGVAPEQQYACGSSANRINSNRANEIICFHLDSSLDVLVVAPVMTNLDAPGGGDDYSKQPKGNLDVTGQYFIWTSNMGGSRLDAFLVKVPGQLLVGAPSDSVPPVVSITAPVSGAAVTGTLPVSASAADNVGVAGVQFRLDGVNLGSEDTVAPFSISWNSAAASNGSHTLTAVARDPAGNAATSVGVLVTVANGDTSAPLISSVSASSVGSSGASISWSTNEASDSQVEYGLTTSYGNATPLNAGLVTAHSQALTALAASSVYHYRVQSRDAAGNLGTSGDFTFTTLVSPGPSEGPVGHWKLDEGSGITAFDSSGNGNAGALSGPTWTAGRVAGALSFDGVNDSVSVPHSNILNAYPVTIAGWFRTSTSGLSGLVNKYLAGSLNGFQVFTSSGSLCAWYFRDASNYIWDGSGCGLAVSGYSDGRWHHVAFVVDASGGRLFVDGLQRASRGWTGTPGPSSTTLNLSFGQYPGTPQPFYAGLLDDLRVYSRALSSDEILGLVSSAPGNTGPGNPGNGGKKKSQM